MALYWMNENLQNFAQIHFMVSLNNVGKILLCLVTIDGHMVKSLKILTITIVFFVLVLNMITKSYHSWDDKLRKKMLTPTTLKRCWMSKMRVWVVSFLTHSLPKIDCRRRINVPTTYISSFCRLLLLCWILSLLNCTHTHTLHT